MSGLPGERPRRGLSPRVVVVLVGLGVWITVYLLVAWPAPAYPTFLGWLPLDYDSSVFGYAGELLRHGARPYVDFWDHKGPLLFLVNAAGLAMAGGRPVGVWLLNVVAALGALSLMFVSVRRALGLVPALLGCVVLAFSLPSVPAVNMTEQYALPIQCASLFVVVRWSGRAQWTAGAGFAIGILGAAGFLLQANQIGGPASAALAIGGALVVTRQVREAVRFATAAVGGAALVVLAVLGWLATIGSLAEFWDQFMIYNLHYASASWPVRIRAAIAGAWLAGQYGSLLLPAAGWALALRTVVRRPANHERVDAVALFVLVWLPVELFLASASGRVYRQYFLALVPCFALASAFLAAALLRMTGGRSDEAGRRGPAGAELIIAAFAAAIALPAALGLVQQVRDHGFAPPELAQVAEVGQYVRAHSAPSDRLLVWGHAAAIYFSAARSPASRYLYSLPLLTPGYADSERVAQFLREVREANPQLIVDASGGDPISPSLSHFDSTWSNPPGQPIPNWSMTPALRSFYEYVAAAYRPVATLGPRRWVVYARRAT